MSKTLNSRILVVGGHTRSIGKTTLVVDLIRAFPSAAWTAGKITQFGHGVCSNGAEACGCAPDDHTVALDWETDASTGTDSARFLEAGARRSFWLRTKQGCLAEGLPLLREALGEGGDPSQPAAQPRNVILESNSLLQFLKPTLYLVVLDTDQSDFKESARLYLDRADAVLFRRPTEAGIGDLAKAHVTENWKGVSPSLLAGKRVFVQRSEEPLPRELTDFVTERYFASRGILL